MKHLESVRAAAKSLNLIDPEGGLVKIDSLTIIDFVVELESRSGVEIPTSAMTQTTFKSIESIASLLSSLEK